MPDMGTLALRSKIYARDDYYYFKKRERLSEWERDRLADLTTSRAAQSGRILAIIDRDEWGRGGGSCSVGNIFFFVCITTTLRLPRIETSLGCRHRQMASLSDATYIVAWLADRRNIGYVVVERENRRTHSYHDVRNFDRLYDTSYTDLDYAMYKDGREWAVGRNIVVNKYDARSKKN